jgi:hypothetical protein
MKSDSVRKPLLAAVFVSMLCLLHSGCQVGPPMDNADSNDNGKVNMGNQNGNGNGNGNGEANGNGNKVDLNDVDGDGIPNEEDADDDDDGVDDVDDPEPKNPAVTGVDMDPDGLTGEAGAPLKGITEQQLLNFGRGRVTFEHEFTISEGLGPSFNRASCAGCHNQPTSGGAAALDRNTYVTAVANPDGSITPLNISTIHPNFSYFFAIPGDPSPDVSRAIIPSTIQVVEQRNPTPLFGMGLIEQIPDEDILANENPNGDPVSGRANISVESGSVGRFGYKAQFTNLEEAIRGQLRNQMGLSTDPLDFVAAAEPTLLERFGAMMAAIQILPKAKAQAPGAVEPSADADFADDPEVPPAELRNLVEFVRLLAAPTTGDITASYRRGERLFSEIGCVDCHIPEWVTATGVFRPYSDFLLHDMGEELSDGLVLGSALGGEFRTTPLWGLRFSRPYLHDGRADSIEAAIMHHDGESATSRDAFDQLSDGEKADLITFLESL